MHIKQTNARSALRYARSLSLTDQTSQPEATRMGPQERAGPAYNRPAYARPRPRATVRQSAPISRGRKNLREDSARPAAAPSPPVAAAPTPDERLSALLGGAPPGCTARASAALLRLPLLRLLRRRYPEAHINFWGSAATADFAPRWWERCSASVTLINYSGRCTLALMLHSFTVCDD